MHERGDFSAIPILDVSPLHSGDAAAVRQVAERLRGYLETVGFVYVAGHGVPEASVQAVRAASRRFFALPEDDKLRIRIDRNFPRLSADREFDHRHVVGRAGQQTQPERIPDADARGGGG